jgi:hypothetical protein
MNIQVGVKVTCWATWAVCAGSLLAIANLGMRVAAHPLNTSGAWVTFCLLFGFPFLVISASAWPARRGGILLTLQLFLAVLASFIAVRSASAEMDLTLFFLDARAAGQKGMACGPPPLLIYIPVGCVISLVAAILGAVSLTQGLSRRGGEFAWHQHGWDRTPLSALGLSARGQRWAEQNGITSVAQVSRLAEEGICVADGFTEEILHEVRQKLAALGLELEDDSSR